MGTPAASKGPEDIFAKVKRLERQVRQLATLAQGRKISPVFATSLYAEDNNVSGGFTSSGAIYDAGTILVPDGYGTAHILYTVSAGASYINTTEGNQTVQPVVAATYGPAINSGNGSVSVANAFWSVTLTGLTAGQRLDFGVYVFTGPTSTPDSGSCNWHSAASIIFLN